MENQKIMKKSKNDDSESEKYKFIALQI